MSKEQSKVKSAIVSEGVIFYVWVIGFVLILVHSGQVAAQDIKTKTIIWELDSAINLQNNRGMSYQGQIKTQRDQSLQWIQRGGQKVSNYQVVRTEGNWADVQQNGSITYYLTHDGHDCVAIFQRTSQNTSVTIDFGGGVRSKFIVGSIK